MILRTLLLNFKLLCTFHLQVFSIYLTLPEKLLQSSAGHYKFLRSLWEEQAGVVGLRLLPVPSKQLQVRMNDVKTILSANDCCGGETSQMRCFDTVRFGMVVALDYCSHWGFLPEPETRCVLRVEDFAGSPLFSTERGWQVCSPQQRRAPD